MKTLFTLLACLFVGCGKSEISKDELSKKSVVGSYETTEGKDAFRLIILENGKFENHFSGKMQGKGTWEFYAKELHALEDGKEVASVFKIEPNGDLTEIANKSSSGSQDIPKDNQITFKKLK